VTPNTTPTRRHQPARPCGRRADRASPGTAQHVACILVLAHRRMRRSACGGTVILTSRERELGSSPLERELGSSPLERELGSSPLERELGSLLEFLTVIYPGPLPFGGWRSCATVTCGAYVRDITVLVRERQFIEDIAFRSASRYVIDLASQTRRTFVASRHRGPAG